MKKTTVDKV